MSGLTARGKFMMVPPRKARLVVDQVRGKGVNEADSILKFSPRTGAKKIEKLLKSAIANATADGKVDPDNLFIREVYVDEGPVLKRYMSRAQGRATRKDKRTSHVTLKLAER